MKRKYFFQLLSLGVLLLFHSCDPQIKDDSRILIKGSIVDGNNNPIPNISVRSQVYNSTLGEAITDVNGQFQFTSLEVENNYSLNIRVNLKPYDDYYYDNYIFNETENPDYSGKNYYSNSTNRSATTYNLGQIQLNKAARLTVLFNNIPGDANNVAYKLEYKSAICEINLGELNNPEDCSVNDDYYHQLDINTTNFQTNLNSQLGTTVLLKYIMNNEPEQTISILLTNIDNTYVFEF